MTNPATQRPAETGGALGAAVIAIARVFGVKDPDTLAGLGIIAGTIPAAITWLVVTVRR